MKKYILKESLPGFVKGIILSITGGILYGVCLGIFYFIKENK